MTVAGKFKDVVARTKKILNYTVHIHSFKEVVCLDIPWTEALKGFDPGISNKIRCVGKMYEEVSGDGKETEFVLINLPSGEGWTSAQNWALEKGFEPTSPRECLAICKQRYLLRELGVEGFVHIIATSSIFRGGFHQTCFVALRGEEMNAFLTPAHGLKEGFNWFLFKK